MSYARMDHAGWVQGNIKHGKATGDKPRRDQYGHVKGWHGAPDELTEFQARVMDILGMVYAGIYNAPISWDAVQWTGWGGGAIGVPVGSESLATFDFDRLSRLVFLCHEARIRCEVRPNGPRGLLLAFWQRVHEGGMATRHPNLAEAVADFRAYLPADHRIVYREPADAAASPVKAGLAA